MEDDRRVDLTRQAKSDHSVGWGRHSKYGRYIWDQIAIYPAQLSLSNNIIIVTNLLIHVEAQMSESPKIVLVESIRYAERGHVPG